MISRICTIIILLVLNSQAQSLLDKIQNKFLSLNTLKGNFNQVVENQGERSSAVSGELIYKKKNFYRIKFGKHQIISDGNSVWNVDENLKRVVITPVENDPFSFSLYNYLIEYPKLCKIEEEYKDGLKLVPAGDELEVEYIKIWCDSAGLISKVELMDYNENAFILTFEKIETNVKIKDELFSFTPSDGIKVIDLR